MKAFPKSLTLVGVVVAIAAVLVDPAVVPFLSTILGEHVATKIAALGAIIAAFGRALQEPSATPPADVDPTP